MRYGIGCIVKMKQVCNPLQPRRGDGNFQKLHTIPTRLRVAIRDRDGRLAHGAHVQLIEPHADAGRVKAVVARV